MSKTECEHPDDCTYLCGKCGKVAGCLLCDTVAHTYFECKGKREETRTLTTMDGTTYSVPEEKTEEGLFDQPPTLDIEEMPPVPYSPVPSESWPTPQALEALRTGPTIVDTPKLETLGITPPNEVRPVGQLKTGPLYKRNELLAHYADKVYP